MDGIEDTLERPVGPLPLWGWLAVGIVGIGVIVLLRRGSGGGSSGGIAAGPPGAGALDPANDSPNLTADAVNASIDEAIASLVDYGNANWLSDSNGAGSDNVVPVASATVAPTVTAAPSVTTSPAARAYGTGYSMLPDWAQSAAQWFFRSDTSSGLSTDWGSAPEDARAQLRQLIDQGWAYREDGYVGSRPY